MTSQVRQSSVLAKWLLGVVGSASTVRSAQRVVEQTVAFYLEIDRIARDDRYSDEFLGNVVRSKLRSWERNRA